MSELGRLRRLAMLAATSGPHQAGDANASAKSMKRAINRCGGSKSLKGKPPEGGSHLRLYGHHEGLFSRSETKPAFRPRVATVSGPPPSSSAR
jgi:hypothetical protein